MNFLIFFQSIEMNLKQTKSYLKSILTFHSQNRRFEFIKLTSYLVGLVSFSAI